VHGALTPLDHALSAGQVDAELIRPGVPTPTVAAAAAALGVRNDQILKSLVFTNGSDFVLAIACGLSRVSAVKLEAAAGYASLKLAKPPVVLERTGYPVGAMPPVAHATSLTVIMDARVADLDIAIAGGGHIDALLRISPAEIMRCTGATVADIVE
jgi:prolyl-tRNA editing enzyme YbaK/EbsC (Cys-tRNA(Pro) deacylase)